MVLNAANDRPWHHLHLMHLYVEEQLLVKSVMHLTRKEAVLGETYDGGDLQWLTPISLNFKPRIYENRERDWKNCKQSRH